MKKKMIITASMLALCATTFFGCGQKHDYDGVVDVLEYVTVSFDGEDGSGTAHVDIDYDGLEYDMAGGKKNLESLDSMEDMPTLSKYMNFAASLSFDIDRTTDLKNGDTVTVSYTCDEAAAKDAGVTIEGEKEKAFTVKGLK